MISSRSVALLSSSASAAPYSSPRRIPRFIVAASATSAAPPARARPRSSGTLYEVLGVAAAASALEIKAAYRRLARACHPDAVASGRKGASADEFMRVHAAYETLSDPEKRADYDRDLVPAAGRRRQPFYSYAAGCPRGRTWETDQCW